MAVIHHRQPLCLVTDEIDAWLDPTTAIREVEASLAAGSKREPGLTLERAGGRPRLLPRLRHLRPCPLDWWTPPRCPIPIAHVRSFLPVREDETHRMPTLLLRVLARLPQLNPDFDEFWR